MKRQTYVDEIGDPVNQAFESKKPILHFFFIFGTILPIIIIILIGIQVFQNNKCLSLYKTLKKASLEYAKGVGEVPSVEGENTSVRISDLYSEEYLSSNQTNNAKCTGSIKITKYKKDYIYTVDARGCGECSVNLKYSSWSKEQSTYPSGKAIVDVIPYYNYYTREVNVTKWSEYYDEDALSDETSKYGIKLPLDEGKLPKTPAEAKITNIENDTTYYYRYRDRRWKWYDIEGDYSEFSSEQPQGYANKDEGSSRYTEWTEYSLNYPEEKDYRTISSATGYKFYYVNSKGKKIYYNGGNYTARSDVNTDKYNRYDEETATLYRYRDKQWRWYNGTRRKYSALSAKAPNKKPYKDRDTETLGDPTSWKNKSTITSANQEYRTEEKKLMTRFRVEYEILSTKEILRKPLNKADFTEKVHMSVPLFASLDDYKLHVTYKFKYRQS